MIGTYVPYGRRSPVDKEEWALLITIGALLSVTTLGWSLVSAIWTGRRLRRVPLAGGLAVLLVAASIVLMPDRPTDQVLLAGISETHIPCPGEATILAVELHGHRALLPGTGEVLGECGIWALIEDPRTGALWLQGPAHGDAFQWSLDLVLGTDDPADTPLAYRIDVLAAAAETHRSWLAASLPGAPISLSTPPASSSWLAGNIVILVVGDGSRSSIHPRKSASRTSP